MNYQKYNAIIKLSKVLRKLLKLSYPVIPSDIYNSINKLDGNIIISSKNKIINQGKTFDIIVSDDNIFKITHMLGHLFLDMGYMINQELWNNSMIYDDEYSLGIQNYYADVFSYNLIIYQDDFLNVIRDNVDDQSNIRLDILSKHFGITNQDVRRYGRFLNVLI